MRFIFVVVYALFFSSTFSQTFIGEVTTHNGYQYLNLEIKNDSTFISFPYEMENTFTFHSTPDVGNLFTIKAKADQRNLIVKKVDKTQIELETQFTGYQQSVILRKQLDPIPEDKLEYYSGNYIDKNGIRIIIYSGRGYLRLMSPYTEQTVSLKPVGENQFWSSSGENIIFTDKSNKKFQQISITNRMGNELMLKRSHDYTVKEDWVMVDGDSIYVNLFIPELEGKLPACLLLPGGGGQSQMENFKYEARLFAAHGMIAMTFDKAGVGKSKGLGFENYTFEEKVLRYQQLFDYLKNHKQVNPGKAGIHGPSEGGRLALMMGIKFNDEVAFINATAAPIMTMKEGQLFAADHYHRNLGLSEEEIVSINSIWKIYYNGIINENIDTSNFALIRELRLKYNRIFIPPASTIIPLSPKKEDLLDSTVVTEANKISCPVFLQYGENDQRVNPSRSLQNFYKNITNTLSVTAEVYPRGNHSMMTPEFQICSGYAYDKIKWFRSINIIQ